MTWSIVAREPETGRFGIAISTCAFAVGAICPWARAGTGALSTQAHTNPMHGALGIELMAKGLPVGDALRMTLGHDEGRDIRQVHGVDARGDTFTHTGAACVDWCGHASGENVTVAGNMLAGPAVVAETLARYEASAGQEFGDRLLTALEAGEAAGGDKRGKQSAALIIQGSEPYREADIRVDDHAEPIAELRRLFTIYADTRRAYMQTMGRTQDFAGIVDHAERERFVLAHRGR
ncbi:MAG: DUF1028 domain-containing protein [Nisaea sp.]|jgi:uncharacterized Ntn-hydrolase superfamily protein|uniref:DUF1028 domain-containing protein n=1 Tax=Nisaea sp. TaxID=2024842 RepID=UPI001B1DC022|nr:DUF1028 domain-containing protein [Nisaea sp.]MBO6560319.1 DUF1028 domain-containing protein [Nisaea sp.]